MFTVTSNPEKNRLTIILEGHLDEAERRAAAQAVLAEVAKLQPGFDVIDDISALHATDQGGMKELARIQAALKLKGAHRVIRVVKIALSRLQFARASEQSRTEVELASSLQEAEQMLENPAP